MLNACVRNRSDHTPCRLLLYRRCYLALRDISSSKQEVAEHVIRHPNVMRQNCRPKTKLGSANANPAAFVSLRQGSRSGGNSRQSLLFKYKSRSWPRARFSTHQAGSRACHRSLAPSHGLALRLPPKQFRLCCSTLAAPRNVGMQCKASSSLALRARGPAASQFIARCAKAQRLHHSQRSGGCGQQASWLVSRPVRLARLSIAVFNQAMSSPTTAANALPNHSLNRTHCGMPAFGPPFHSGPNTVMPQRAG